MTKPVTEFLSEESKKKIVELLQGAEKVMPEFAVAFEKGDFPAARAGVGKIREAMTATCDGLLKMIDEIEYRMANEGENTGDVDVSDV
jgi:hypothetical protein